MRLMLLQEWKHVRILNLSDLRNGNSGSFSIEYENAMKIDPHIFNSLTNSNRHTELKKYCSESSIIIAAWGTTEVLREAALSFLNIIDNVKGLTLDKPWYRYPSPYRKDQKMDWLKKMNDSLVDNKTE